MLHPWIVGLVVGHGALLLVFSMGLINAGRIYCGWDYESSTEKQFALEKKTYLVSAVMDFALVMQIVMLMLLVMAADELADVLPGAMCAVGTLSANRWGFLLLDLKIVAFFIYFSWLVINWLDNRLETYPLVRKKYLILMLIYPLPLAETIFLFLFAANLDPSVITSCCGSVYSAGTGGWGGLLAGAANRIVLPLFFGIVAALAINRLWVRAAGESKRRWRQLLEIPLWGAFFITALAVVISFISTYVYEMLSHNCPFCFMSAEYHYYGLPLYLFLFAATATGLTGSLLAALTRPQNLRQMAGELQKKLHAVSLWATAGFLVTGFVPFFIYYLKTGRLI